jgi:citrate lyase subunit beta/citryl-CoA lyase
MVRRSLLFSPGDQPDLMRKAAAAGADVIVLDLEDAVAPAANADAREGVADVVADPGLDPDAEVCVRVNADPGAATEDLDAALTDGGPVDSIMQPNVGGAADVADLAALFDER